MPSTKIDLDSPEVQKILVALKEREELEAAAVKVVRDAQKSLVTEFLSGLTTSDPKTFESGASGWQVGGTFEVPKHGKVRVNVLVRIESTIPAKS